MSSELSKITHPFIYEINTWPWLAAISKDRGAAIDLGSVPDRYWDEIADLGFDGVWLMGVWQRSPAGVAIALSNDGLRASFESALPDWQAEDVVGSPYCIRDYVVDDHLGGPDGLARAREALAARGMGLILDFVPNHVAPDHPWTTHKPEVLCPVRPRICRRIRRRSWRLADEFSPTGVTPTSPLGPMWFSSMPSPRRSGLR
jgi:hypothetical protein